MRLNAVELHLPVSHVCDERQPAAFSANSRQTQLSIYECASPEDAKSGQKNMQLNSLRESAYLHTIEEEFL